MTEWTEDQLAFRSFSIGVLYARSVLSQAIASMAELDPRPGRPELLRGVAARIADFPTPNPDAAKAIVEVCRADARTGAELLAALIGVAADVVDHITDDHRKRQ